MVRSIDELVNDVFAMGGDANRETAVRLAGDITDTFNANRPDNTEAIEKAVKDERNKWVEIFRERFMNGGVVNATKDEPEERHESRTINDILYK